MFVGWLSALSGQRGAWLRRHRLGHHAGGHAFGMTDLRCSDLTCRYATLRPQGARADAVFAICALPGAGGDGLASGPATFTTAWFSLLVSSWEPNHPRANANLEENMSVTVIGAAVIGRAAAPLIKDLYEGAKGEVKKSLSQWNTAGFQSKISKKILEIDKVRTIWSPEKNVSLRCFYHPNKLKKSSGGSGSPLASLADLGDGCHVIQGIVGQGKSILLRYLALQEVIFAEKPRIPVFIELRKVTSKEDIMALVFKTMAEYQISVTNDVFEYLAISGRIVLILDGFDELENALVKQATIDLEHLAKKYSNLQIVVSARPNSEVQKLHSFQIHEISPLGRDDYLPFLTALGLESGKIGDLLHAINSSPSKVSELITTPLMLTLVVFVYQSEKQIPEDLPEFFERLFYTVFTRHDKLKAAFEREHYSGLSERKLQHLFEAFCFMALQLGSNRTLSPDQFSEAFELAQDYVEGSQCKEAAFRKDVTKVACLMLEEGIGDATFLHKSIAEYHAASFVKGSDDSFASRFYSEAAKSPMRWRECLNFLRSIDQYRYAKMFALEHVGSAIRQFKELRDAETGKKMVAKLPSWIKEVSVRYKDREGGGKTYSCSAFGSWSTANNIYTADLSNVLSQAAFKTAPAVLTASQIAELRSERVKITENDGELEIPLANIFDRWGFEDFRELISARIQELESQLERASTLSDKLSNRAMIFDRKKKD